MIKELKKENMYTWVTYINPFNGNEHGRIKSYNNDTKTAFVVFKCNNDWGNWFDYTAQGVKYSDLEFGKI